TALDVGDSPRHQPLEPSAGLRNGALAADFEQTVTDERRIPDRRYARLAIGLVLVHGEELVDGSAGDRAQRMMLRIAQRVEHHHAVRHRRENRTQTVFAVETLRY